MEVCLSTPLSSSIFFLLFSSLLMFINCFCLGNSKADGLRNWTLQVSSLSPSPSYCLSFFSCLLSLLLLSDLPSPQGSNDAKQWTILIRHANDNSLNGNYASCSWPIPNCTQVCFLPLFPSPLPLFLSASHPLIPLTLTHHNTRHTDSSECCRTDVTRRTTTSCHCLVSSFMAISMKPERCVDISPFPLLSLSSPPTLPYLLLPSPTLPSPPLPSHPLPPPLIPSSPLILSSFLFVFSILFMHFTLLISISG